MTIVGKIRTAALKYRIAFGAGVVVVVALVATGAYASYLGGRILPHTFVGVVPVGGLTQDQARERLDGVVVDIAAAGIRLNIEGTVQVIQADAIGFDLDTEDAVARAFARGHQGSGLSRVGQRIASLWAGKHQEEAPVRVDRSALASEVTDIAATLDTDRRDIRLSVTGTTVTLLTDTKSGRVLDRDQAVGRVIWFLDQLSGEPITLSLMEDQPQADPALAPAAVALAQKMISRALLLKYEDLQFYISRERIGTWVTSGYDEKQLKPVISNELVGQYVTTVAKTLNVDPIPPSITTDGGRVTGFTPAKVGRAVQEDALIDAIGEALAARTDTDKVGDTIVVPLKATRLSLTGLDSGVGITELIGKATTPFTGSPKNRISNIKNGVKFLSGTVVEPGAEFSTLATLGIIDNTTGYLPELVIKGDRTTPEFGGGLCQVSTTLFRAVMNAGLPVTARRNHSYRVSYYEKDGDGKVIGPGLDATIYQPDLDFKFLNDTKTPVLIIGYVSGDKITFELYGTKDGRTSTIDGPHTLTTTPPGPAQYIESVDIPVGTTKQVETPHPGGSAVATYTITYANGTTKAKEFKSYYRPWPAKFLKGVSALTTPMPVSPTQ